MKAIALKLVLVLSLLVILPAAFSYLIPFHTQASLSSFPYNFTGPILQTPIPQALPISTTTRTIIVQGPKGDIGPAGAQGIQGPPGPAGPAGGVI